MPERKTSSGLCVPPWVGVFELILSVPSSYVFFIPNELSQCHQTISGVIVNSAKTIIIIFISDNKSNMNNLNLDILEKNINRNTYY